MRPPDSTTEKLLRIAEPVCTGAGYELVDLSLTQSRGGWVLRVFIDHLPPVAGASLRLAGGEPSGAMGLPEPVDPTEIGRSEIGFDDCERISRELGAVLDVEDPIGHAYHLEVSSPGVDRPLRKLSHFRRFLGQEARIRLLHGAEGRRSFKGTLVAVSPEPATPEAADEDRATITLNVDGKDYELPYGAIESARLVPDWDAIMGKRTGSAGRP